MSEQLELENKQLKHEMQKLRSENSSLRNEKYELKQIINSIDANIYWKDTDGKMLGMNHSCLKFLGLSDMSEAIGKSSIELSVIKNTGLDIHKNDLKVIENDKTSIFEEKVLFKEKEQTFLSQKSPLKDENGKTIGIIGVSIDISQQKKLQAQLERKKAELEKKNKEIKSLLDNQKSSFQQIVDNIEANIYWKDTDGKMLGMNLCYLKYLGLSDMNEAIGKRDVELSVMKNTSSDLYKNDLKVIEGDTTLIFEEKVLFEGKEQTFLSQKSPLKDENGKVIGIIGVSIDITKQKKLQHELEKKNNELREKDKKRSEAAEAIFDVLAKI
ncbi:MULTISPECIES: PAS domain-containing protein [Francisella]|uniref:PAS domain S-box protein n=1 Tax=Francisella opportunistica TaxID=2016517 RepID=A0A345JPS6_9GAMM|nr:MULTISPECIES: PAS domain-containing protein [Francisella]APC90999.1 hypothetical protein BBG19_0261 [Francisella sp. MA067296]AXH29322.1 PAS domain S-box protein [Francisella opportunistica]AXH30973.1 hypothetical protein CGC44_01295 [Francisella opportunistica]AXH32620.1 hypothetical protein CGC45_01295 [Francisella opportunistica]